MIHDVRARDPRILIRFHYVNAHVIHVLMFSTSSNAQFIERSWWPSGLSRGTPKLWSRGRDVSPSWRRRSLTIGYRIDRYNAMSHRTYEHEA